MNVILLEPVGKLGDAGEKVRVRPGYARNFLEARLAQRARLLSERKSDAERLRELLAEASLEIRVRAGEDRIYGSVTSRDIAEALQAAYEVEVDRRKLELAQPIKTLGSYTVVYKPHPEVPINLNVVISAET